MARSRPGSRPSPSMQRRSASTMAAPPQHAPAQHAQQPNAYSHPPAAQQSQGGGLFSQMASTAAGVAVGSAVGHTIGAGLSGVFGGSSEPQQQQQPQQVASADSQALNQNQARPCDMDARSFTRCLDENNGNFQICDYYLQQLKACQEAARQY
ncbi:MIC17 (YMR002W) [Zygosaccharomyces parabailii]|nr:MIC17 (YMR002W) [Zygosaccharomyces parabailii]CDH08385.1 related to Mitochondrial intermembrane space cysteine motif-containing protein MIC17 [Zygosaccharomyces bailii ISA1307]